MGQSRPWLETSDEDVQFAFAIRQSRAVSRLNRPGGNGPLHEKIRLFVERPPAEVWAFVSDLSKLSEWRPRLQDIHWLDEPARVGSRFEGLSTFALWRKVRLVCRIEQWDPPTHYRYEVIEGPIRAGALWGVRPRGQRLVLLRCRRHRRELAAHPSPGTLAKPLFVRETQSELRRLKEILEGGQ